jgi:hypothetical protein
MIKAVYRTRDSEGAQNATLSRLRRSGERVERWLR